VAPTPLAVLMLPQSLLRDYERPSHIELAYFSHPVKVLGRNEFPESISEAELAFSQTFQLIEYVYFLITQGLSSYFIGNR
jgi:hypothetical protein